MGFQKKSKTPSKNKNGKVLKRPKPTTTFESNNDDDDLDDVEEDSDDVEEDSDDVEDVKSHSAEKIKKEVTEENSNNPLTGSNKKKRKRGKKTPTITRTEEDQKRTLFIRNLPNDVTHEELRALSPDIINVSIPFQRKRTQVKYGFLEFDNEEKAEKNFAVLQKKMLRDAPIFLDYCGVKNITRPKKQDENGVVLNVRRLRISGLPSNATVEDIAEVCPKAAAIHTTDLDGVRSADVVFLQRDDAAEFLEANKNAKINGAVVTFAYAPYPVKTEGSKRGKFYSNKKKPKKQKRRYQMSS